MDKKYNPDLKYSSIHGNYKSLDNKELEKEIEVYLTKYDRILLIGDFN